MVYEKVNDGFEKVNSYQTWLLFLGGTYLCHPMLLWDVAAFWGAASCGGVI